MSNQASDSADDSMNDHMNDAMNDPLDGPLDGDVLGEDERTLFDDSAMHDDEKRVRRDFWVTVRKAAAAVPFMDEVVAAYYCALDRETPTRVRATLLGALAYFVLPLDGIPDFILGLGFTDDVAVIMGVLALMRSHITDEHREAAKKALLKQG